MAVYKYLCVTESGQEKKGFLEGDSENHIREKLREMGLIPLEVSKTRHKKGQSSWADIFSFKKNISQTDLSMLTYQFATLLKAGLPAEECLHSMAEQSEKSHMKSILLGVHGHVTEGERLSDSMGH